MNVKIALIAAFALPLTVFLGTGRFIVERPAQGLFVFTVDRFTGATRLCNASGCRDLPNGTREESQQHDAVLTFDDLIPKEPKQKDPWGLASKGQKP